MSNVGFDPFFLMCLAALLLQMAGAQGGRAEPATENIERAAKGFAGLVAAGFMVHSAAIGFGGYARLVSAVVSMSLAWSAKLSALFIALVVISSTFNFVGGLSKPAPRDIGFAVLHLLWLVGFAAAWCCDFYVPAGLADEFAFLRDLNWTLRLVYLVGMAFSAWCFVNGLRNSTPDWVLPEPETIPDNVMSGPASEEEADAALR